MGEATVTLDLDALTHNVQQLRNVAPHSALFAMVKSNAYGHGLCQVATHLLDKIDYLGVATLAEGVTLSRHLPKRRPHIVVMRGPRSLENARALVNHRLQCVIHHIEQIQWLTRLPSQSLGVWLKINTGMNRLGVDVQQVSHTLQQLEQCDSVNAISVLSHLGMANDANNSMVIDQIEQFHAATHHVSYRKSLANSAALLNYPYSHVDIIRPGLLLYGISTMPLPPSMHLKPVMTFSAPIIDMQTVQPGQWIGYGATWQAKRRTHIAIVGAGYANGYPMHMPSGTPVLLQGRRAQTIGQVSMDMLAIDITDFDAVEIGEIVCLWGAGVPVEEIARCANISPYALVTQIQATSR